MGQLSAICIALSLLLSGTTAFVGPVLHRSTRHVARPAKEDSVPAFPSLDGSEVRVGIIKARWNGKIVTELATGVRKSITELNVKQENIFETEVPGSFELPIAARFLALSQTVDVIVCLGCLIKGETMHFEYIAEAVSHGIMDVQLQTSTPCVFGVLTALDEKQAEARTGHGVDYGKTAVEMGLLRMSALGQLKSPPRLGFGVVDEKDGSKKSPVEPNRRIGF